MTHFPQSRVKWPLAKKMQPETKKWYWTSSSEQIIFMDFFKQSCQNVCYGNAKVGEHETLTSNSF